MLNHLWGLFSRIQLVDLLDILILTVIIYNLLLLVRGTRGWYITVGILSIIASYYVAHLLHLRALEWLLDNFSGYIIIALIVIFQNEIRKGLAELGRGSILTRMRQRRRREAFEEIVLAATTLSNRGIGGLMVLEGTFGLRNYIENGIEIDAALTYDLLVTIFTPNTPLHDGAVIIQNDRIAAAACFLPLTLDPAVSSELGTRHRAAIGITEESDAIAIVISEETGVISAVFEGKMVRNMDGPGLLNYLRQTEKARGKGLFEKTAKRRSEGPRRQEAM
ncbi:MAG TPA: diadenylate cyclase CdaA [Acidobacteriota bacterium]|nr:diadenylate cyclase CdaA [Acidobacteriota bacterium]